MKSLELMKKMCTLIEEYGDCGIAVVSIDKDGEYVKTNLDVYLRVETHNATLYFIIC